MQQALPSILQPKDLPANYIPYSADGEFTLMVNSPVYRVRTTPKGYYRNKKTGENCGQRVELHVKFCEGFKIFDEPMLEEDCYEIVYDEG
jgi:hypothetical protein